MSTQTFDLLDTVEYGGCSAKLDPLKLKELLRGLPLLHDERVMVDVTTHDDAGVYRISEEEALIVTTDFFPPVCSDAYTFGRIAAVNALSDVYAMGGIPLLALNLTLFPSKDIPLEVLADILRGGQDAINESGALTMGGHTIDDAPPKYGLAVVGRVHPNKLITNAGARAGQVLVLSKPLGTGVAIAAHRLGMIAPDDYEAALRSMQLLNKTGAELMQQYGVRGATDVTGFGLVGHALGMAQASQVSMDIDTAAVPALPGVRQLLDEGCIPGAAFRNIRFAGDDLAVHCSLAHKMLMADAQTSGGLLMAVDASVAEALVADLRASGLHPEAAIVGMVTEHEPGKPYLSLY
ncbi:selenide, water dikinase SelD [Porphyromonas sp. COT-239 OH1446]|uniref:selenide, water dikinase SelD n=1 Tax=Porphyromonas sp. COT-239 OH1446 TaxID=1515613 RepID=UPI00052E3AE7|nr:selenide, water dikinase SelD [Porphyromonas sp. COT-239 OH1446]KGN68114.1 segregation protein A [Porphyromonas sp. COT-239 OH1446]